MQMVSITLIYNVYIISCELMALTQDSGLERVSDSLTPVGLCCVDEDL